MHEGHSHHGHESKSAGKELALLEYMANHNRQHTEELHSLSHELKKQGRGDEAGLIAEAEAHFTKGTDLLYKALNQLKTAKSEEH